MNENTPDRGVDVRNVVRNRSDEGREYEAVQVAVPVVNPQSDSRDSYVDDGDLVGELPVTNADTPCADEHLDAAAITVLDERVSAYYPREDDAVVLVWEAATDDWRCDEIEVDGEFDVADDRRDADESVVWEREP